MQTNFTQYNLSKVQCRPEHYQALILPKFQLNLQFELILGNLSPFLFPGVAMNLKHADFYMNNQLKILLDKYH